MATTRLMTIDDLMQLADDGHHYDVIDGELYQMPPVGGDHGYLAIRLGTRLTNFIEERQLGRVYGETTFILAREPSLTSLSPDVSFVRADRVIPALDHHGPLDQPPDIAVEIRSPSDSVPFVIRKMERYTALGVKLGWIVDPSRRTVTIHEPSKQTRMLGIGDTLDGSDVLPGFELPLAVLFDL